MTTLAITPNWKNKSAKFKGTVAAGEHVSVTIQNNDGEGGEFIDDASTLRLRVVNPCNGRTLAIFPEPVPEGETPETWDSDLSPLRCTLNLNTVQMLKAVPPAANVPLLWVLDDYDNNTLYFKEQFPVEHWPRLRGEEEPTDLDNYKDIIADFNTRLDGYDTRITGAENAAQAATANASAAAAKANQAVGIANQAVDKAETAQNSAAASAAAAHNSALAAEEAQEAAESAAESINSPDAMLTEEGVAADAKATGEAIAAEESRAKAAEAAEKARAEGVESGLDTRLTAAEKAIDDEAVLRAAADADLEANKADKIAVAAISSDVAAAQTAISNLSANKADKATTYTKTEVDTKIAGVQTFQKYLVNELPDPDEADMKGLYLVPTGETSEEGDLCEEWTVIEENGEKRWEKIGAKAVDLTLDDTVTRTSANGVKSSGIWSAIWGALSALPTGFTSLYDWCVDQLAGKMPSTATGADIPVDATHGARKINIALAGKQSVLTQNQLANIAAVSDALAFDATHSYAAGDPVVYNGTLYTFTSAHTGAWTGSDVSAVDIIARLAGKLDKSGDTMTGGLTVPNLTVGSREEGSVVGENSVVEGHNNVADGTCAHAEGVGTAASGSYSHAEGFSTMTENSAEHAQGRYNVSHNSSTTIGDAGNTLSSIGFGVRDNDRKNAVETMQDGKTYIYGLGGYDGTNPTNSVDLAASVNGKLDKSGGTVTGNLAIGPNSNYSAKFESDPSGVVSLMLRDNIGNMLIIGGFKLYFQQYDWQAGVELFFPSTDGTLALAATNPTAGNLAALDADGNPTDSTIPAANVALKGNIPYDLGTPTVIDTASSETVEGETVNYGVATLVNRTANIVQVTAATALDELRITFPAATSGKVRDFGLRVEIGTGSAALAAPALVPVAPTGETIKIENVDGTIPELADGTATAKGVTLLYFSETASGVFVVKGEQVEEVA